jgi:hypothetical protein
MRRTTATATTETSWIVPGAGLYLCSEHRMQFPTVAASHDHSREFHPVKLWTMVSRFECINEQYGAKIVDMRDMGGGIALYVQSKLWDSGYTSIEHARDCFIDMAAHGRVKPVGAK